MATQPFDGAQFVAVSSSPAICQNSISGNADRTALGAAIGDGFEPETVNQPTVELRLLGKGVGWGLGIEGFGALSLYAIWRLWHLWIS